MIYKNDRASYNNFDIVGTIGAIGGVVDTLGGLFQSKDRKVQIAERERAAVAMGFKDFNQWKENGGEKGLIPINRPDAQAAYNYMYDYNLMTRPSNSELIQAGYLSPDGSTWSEDGRNWVDKNAISLKYFGVPYSPTNQSLALPPPGSVYPPGTGPQAPQVAGMNILSVLLIAGAVIGGIYLFKNSNK